jgi:glucokinase
MPDILLADIGGTTSRLAFAGADGRPERIVAIPNDSVAGPEAAIRQCIACNGTAPRGAVLAVAGPVDGDEIALTNRAWRFSLRALAQRFGFARIRAVNDFEALAWALPHLGPGDLRPLGPHAADRPGAKVVLGPGTGLGVAALLPCAEGWQAVASEGGHASFGPAAADEVAVFARLREECGAVSAETILSGPGLARLHAALHPGALRAAPEMIVTQARAGLPAARATVALFVRLLGRFAGDAALTFKAGGVYLSGGVALGLGQLLDAKIFRAAFEAHPPYGPLLAQIPTALITYPEPGLLGCAALARQMVQEPPHSVELASG